MHRVDGEVSQTIDRDGAGPLARRVTPQTVGDEQELAVGIAIKIGSVFKTDACVMDVQRFPQITHHELVFVDIADQAAICQTIAVDFTRRRATVGLGKIKRIENHIVALLCRK